MLFDRFWTLLGTLLDPFGHPKSTPKNKPKKDTQKELKEKPVLASEREARFNIEHCPKVFRSSPSMIKTFEANPNTSCGLRPRLRRDLDHAERQEENAVFTLLLAFSMLQLAGCSLDFAVWSVHLALWALELIIKTLQAAV